MVPDVFNTDAVARQDQFETWCSWFDSIFDVLPKHPAEDGFGASSETWNLDGLTISRVHAPSLNAIRSKALIRRNPVDHWVITVGERNPTRIATGDDRGEAAAGVPFVLSLGREFASEREQDGRLQFYLPRDGFRQVAPQLDASLGHAIDTPMGKLLSDYLRMIHCHLPGMAREELSRLTPAVRTMIEACIVPSADRLAAASHEIGATRLEQMRRIVRKNLSSPSLGPNVLCRELGMSRSRLYRLLEQEGGVARHILRQRLLESHARLADASNRQTIAEIGQTLCFADASSFSRAFRREFGNSPRDVRAASAAGSAPAAPPARPAGPAQRCLTDHLHPFAR